MLIHKVTRDNKVSYVLHFLPFMRLRVTEIVGFHEIIQIINEALGFEPRVF
jgi:hypothetical protein